MGIYLVDDGRPHKESKNKKQPPTKGLFQFASCSLAQREIRKRSQGMNLESGTEAEVMLETLLTVLFPTTQSPFFIVHKPTNSGGTKPP